MARRRDKFRYLQTFVDRLGIERNYLRMKGHPAIPLPAVIGSREFIEAYNAAINSINQAIASTSYPEDEQAIPETGVYLLILDDRLIYVGSSMCLRRRMAAHRSNGRIFDKAYFVSATKAEMASLETALIRALRPEQNKLHNNSLLHNPTRRIRARCTNAEGK